MQQTYNMNGLEVSAASFDQAKRTYRAMTGVNYVPGARPMTKVEERQARRTQPYAN